MYRADRITFNEMEKAFHHICKQQNLDKSQLK